MFRLARVSSLARTFPKVRVWGHGPQIGDLLPVAERTGKHQLGVSLVPWITFLPLPARVHTRTHTNTHALTLTYSLLQPPALQFIHPPLQVPTDLLVAKSSLVPCSPLLASPQRLNLLTTPFLPGSRGVRKFPELAPAAFSSHFLHTLVTTPSQPPRPGFSLWCSARSHRSLSPLSFRRPTPVLWFQQPPAC